MTRISYETKDTFELTDRYYGRVECRLEDDDGTCVLFIDGVELSITQVRKLIIWLERADRVLSGIGDA